jgi:putative DNA primase/helicase
VGKAEDQFEAMRQVVHLTSRDDYLAAMLAMPSPLGIGDVVRYDHNSGLWHIWDGFRWAPDQKTYIFELIRERLMNVWFPSKAINPSSDSAKVYASLMDAGKKVSVLKMLGSMPGIAMRGDEWDPDPNLLAFTNGVLDLRTTTFDPTPSPDLLISKSTGHAWNPDADPAPFENFILDIMGGNTDLQFYVLRMLGYALYGHQREQKFWMWVGEGQNGKGTLARVVTAALGTYAESPSDTLYMRTKGGSAGSDKPRPELLKLRGLRFTWMSEPNGGQFNEELLKAHSGNDPIQARDLYKGKDQFLTFSPTHTINFLTNNPPRTDDVGASMQRRVRIIKFEQDYRGAREDKGLEERLRAEPNIEGALVSMVTAAALYEKAKTIPEPKAITDWSAEYIAENDPFTEFIDEMCVLDPLAEAPAGEMWKTFDAWSERNGLARWTQTGFGLAMGRRFPKEHKVSGKVYKGVRVKNFSDKADDNE